MLDIEGGRRFSVLSFKPVGVGGDHRLVGEKFLENLKGFYL